MVCGASFPHSLIGSRSPRVFSQAFILFPSLYIKNKQTMDQAVELNDIKNQGRGGVRGDHRDEGVRGLLSQEVPAAERASCKSTTLCSFLLA